MIEPQHQSPVAMVRQIAASRGVEYEFTMHAEQEMAADGIDRLDVRNALANCRSVKEQNIDGEIRYVIEGNDTEQRKITVVVELLSDGVLRICVVTAWRRTKK